MSACFSRSAWDTRVQSNEHFSQATAPQCSVHSYGWQILGKKEERSHRRGCKASLGVELAMKREIDLQIQSPWYVSRSMWLQFSVSLSTRIKVSWELVRVVAKGHSSSAMGRTVERMHQSRTRCRNRPTIVCQGEYSANHPLIVEGK